MKVKIMPKTLQGRRALFFSFLFVTSGAASTLVSSITDNKIEYPNPLNSPLLGTLIYLTFVLAFITFFYTAKALLKYKDQTVLLYLLAVVSGWFSFTGLIFFGFLILMILGFTL